MRFALFVVIFAISCVEWECTANKDHQSSGTDSGGSQGSSPSPTSPTTESSVPISDDNLRPLTDVQLKNNSPSNNLSKTPSDNTEDSHGSEQVLGTVATLNEGNGKIGGSAGSPSSTGTSNNQHDSDLTDDDNTSEENDNDDDHNKNKNTVKNDVIDHASSKKTGSSGRKTDTGASPPYSVLGSTAPASKPGGENSGDKVTNDKGSTLTHTNTDNASDVTHEALTTGENKHVGTDLVTRSDESVESATGNIANTQNIGSTMSGKGMASSSPGGKAKDKNDDQSQDKKAKQPTLTTSKDPAKSDSPQTSSDLSFLPKQKEKNKMVPAKIPLKKSEKNDTTSEDAQKKSDKAIEQKKQTHNERTVSKPPDTKSATEVSRNKDATDALKLEPVITTGKGVPKHSTTTTQMEEEVAPTEQANKTSTPPNTLNKKPIKKFSQLQSVDMADGSSISTSLLLVFCMFPALLLMVTAPAY